MKSFLLGSAAVLLLAGAANAADLPVKAMPMKAPPAVSYDWTGFYIGGYYGSAIGNQKGATPAGTLGSHSGETNVNQLGTTFGATFGYNWQFSPHWLVGAEGDFGWLGILRTNTEFDDVTVVGLKTDWYATARARFGYVTGPSLLYLTGGAAFVHQRDEWGGDLLTVGPTFFATTTTSWTAGGGIETKISRAWSAKTEYLFIDGGGATSFLANPRGVVGVPSTFDHNYQVVKTGLNYKFGENEGLFAFLTAPQLPSDHDWRGFYVGLNAGGGQSLVNAVGAATLGGTQIVGSGFAGGAQAGYNLTNIFGPRWFVGVEGDVGALKIGAATNDWFDDVSRFTADTSWYATARVRAGTNTGPALLYVTAGGAWVHLNEGFANTPPFPTGDLSSRTAGGWTIGGGTEVALDPRWSAKIESLYVDAGHRMHQVTPPGPFGADFKERFMVVRAGLNFKLW